MALRATWPLLRVPATMSMSWKDTLLLAPPSCATLTAGRYRGTWKVQPAGVSWPPLLTVIRPLLLVVEAVKVVPVGLSRPPLPTTTCSVAKSLVAPKVTTSLLAKLRVPLSVNVTPAWSRTLALAPTASVAPEATVTFWPKVEFAATAARDRDPPDAIDRAAVVSFSVRTDCVPAIVMVPIPDLLIVTSSPLPGTTLPDQLAASPQLSVFAPPVHE